MIQKSTYVNCPYCITVVGKADTKKKLGISILKGIYHCFRCGSKGKLKNLDLLPQSDILAGLKTRLDWGLKSSVALDLDEISKKIKKSSKAEKYLTDRGLDFTDIEKFNIREGIPYYKDGEINYSWKDRIVFSVLDDNECVYALGRAFVEGKPRYFNVAAPRKNIVWGLSRVTQGEPVILCEGAFSAIWAEKTTGIKALALLGKVVFDSQLNLIKSKTSDIYVCLDSDVSSKHKKEFIKRLIDHGFNVYDIYVPGETIDGKYCSDPGDYRERFSDLFKQAKKIDNSYVYFS
jgi:DNA primase